MDISGDLTSRPSTWREKNELGGTGGGVSSCSGRLFFYMAHFVIVKKQKLKSPAESHPSQWLFNVASNIYQTLFLLRFWSLFLPPTILFYFLVRNFRPNI